MRGTLLTLAPLALLAGCNTNSAPGNDREAQVDPPESAAPIESAAAALDNVATATVKPETMTAADLAALGGTRGRCLVRLTEVAFPSFVYQPGAAGTIKLNGKLIPLPETGEGRYAAGGLSVNLRELEETGDAGLRAMEMVVVPPGAKDELGYRGYVECYAREPS